LRSNLSNLNSQDGSDINNLINLGRNGLNEYQTGLNNIQSLNNQGVTNWFNNQNQLNSQQQDFENEETWEWPHLQGNSNSTNPHLSGISQAGGVNYALSNPVYSPLASINPQALNANAPLAPFNQNEPAPIAPLAPINNSAQVEAAMQQAQRVAQQQQEAQRRAQEAQMRAQQEAQRLVQQNRDRVDERFRKTYFYNTDEMSKHIDNLPYRNETTGYSWNPAAHFLRNYTNRYQKPDGTLSKYGAHDRSEVEQYINNPLNYPAGYLQTYGKYRFPEVSRDEIEKSEANKPY
jgi:hypothetical protein